MRSLLANPPVVAGLALLLFGFGAPVPGLAAGAAPVASTEDGPPGADPGAGAGRRGAGAAAAAEEMGREPGNELLVALRNAFDDLAALREELAAVRRHNLELRSVQVEDALTIAALKTELANARGEVERLRGEADQAWRWVGELNTVLADVRAARDAAERALAAAGTSGGDDAETRTAGASGGDDAETHTAGASGRDDAETHTAVATRRPAAAPPAPTAPPPAVAPQAPPATAERLLATVRRPSSSGGGRLSAAATTGGRPDDGAGATAAPPAATGAGEGSYRATATVPVNLRGEPSNAADVVAVVGKGHSVRVIGRHGGWRRVEYTDPLSREFTGWIYGSFLERLGPEQTHADAVALPREEG